MKRLVIALAIVGLITGSVFAMLDDNSTNQNQGQLQGQGQGQAQGQGQGQAQAAIAAQGQIAVGEADQSVSVDGDNTSVKSYAVSYPALSGGEGVSQANAYSIFGGLGLSNTEKYKVYITQIQAIEASATLPNSVKADLVLKLVDKMVATNKTQRLLGIGPEVSGRNLLNLFGILSWDSWWKDK